jgi:Tol biopolymer transport system component/DNA-binding winged helix-turn-helix (wHTH) protein
MSKHFYEFGPFRMDLGERLLLRDGEPVPLTPKAFETLLVLVQNRGHVVEKDELMNKVWPDTFVEEVGLARNISVLRKVLEGGSDRHHYIETIPKRGYRFRAEVREWDEGAPVPRAEEMQSARSVHQIGSGPATGQAPALLASSDSAVPGLKTQHRSLKGDSVVITETSTRQRLVQRYIWVTALLVLLGVGVSWWLIHLTTRPADVALEAVPLTSYPGREQEPSLSPDGNQVAFSWNGERQDNFDIYVKLIGSESHLLRLTSAPEADTDPAWSPDGRSIAFIREGPAGKASVHLISPLGPPERIVGMISPTRIESAGTSWPRGLAWTPDGKWLVVTDRNSDSEPLFLLSAESGERRRLTSSPDTASLDSQPAFSPDGRTLAFIRQVAVGVRDVYLLTLSEELQPIGEPKRLTFENRLTFRPVWTPAGREIIFSSGRFLDPNLFRIAASGSSKPQRLAGVGENGYEAAISHRMQRLVYTRVSIDVNIWRLEVPGPDGKISQPMKLTSTSTRADRDAQFSPGGEKIVFNSNRTGNFEIWICDSEGSNPRQITSLGHYCGSPHLSPDGQRVTFDSNLEGQWETYVTSANGGKPQRLTTNAARDALTSWSRDGKWIYFFSDRSGENQIWKIPAGGGEAVPVTRKGGFEALESPDGQWIYYTKSDGASSLWRVPKDGGEETPVLESVDKRAFAIANEGIYFIPKPDSFGRYTIQFFNFTTKKTRPVFTIESEIDIYLSASPDGRWILYSQIDQDGSDLMLVENFR